MAAPRRPAARPEVAGALFRGSQDSGLAVQPIINFTYLPSSVDKRALPRFAQSSDSAKASIWSSYRSKWSIPGFRGRAPKCSFHYTELLYKRFVESAKAVIARGRADLEFSLREYSILSAGPAHPFRPFLTSSSYSKLK